VQLPAVTVSCLRDSGKQCYYTVEVTIDDEDDGATDDSIMIQLYKDGQWYPIDDLDKNDFEHGATDVFAFEDNCKDDRQLSPIGISGHGRFFTCFTDRWLLTHVKVYRMDGTLCNKWSTHKWLSCKP